MASISDDEFISIVIPNLEDIIVYNETLKSNYDKLYEIKSFIKSDIFSMNI